jgi:hypothetical protein
MANQPKVVKAVYLPDDPAEKDDFGTHDPIADELAEAIAESQGGVSVALLGDWGIGKSTVIRGLRRRLGYRDGIVSHLFVYDAWAHQGDSLRRSFLEDFIRSFEGVLTFSTEKREDWKRRIWSTVEDTETTTSPILKRHAAIWLLSLPLFAIGVRLLRTPEIGQEIWAYLSDNCLAAWLLASPAVVFTVLLILSWIPIAGLRTWLFSGTAQTTPSMLSFLVQKTDGSITRKITTSPVDSITAFRDIFIDVVNEVISAKTNIRIVVVPDNIDRLPSEDARELWSTLQTFFSSERPKPEEKYWLIVPFSPDHVTPGASSKVTTEFLEKTFARAIYVPRPILAAWRDHLAVLLSKAFPGSDDAIRLSVRDIFALARQPQALPPTPRQLKSFVNQLVGLYRLRGKQIDLATMAAYILRRDKIVAAVIPDDMLPEPIILLLPPTLDWKTTIAALHFGVSDVEASQILLESPVRAALEGPSPSAISELWLRRGFPDVLSSIVLTMPAGLGEQLARTAEAVCTLPDHDGPPYLAVWRALSNGLRNAKWGGWATPQDRGICQIILHTRPEVRDELVALVIKSFSERRDDQDYTKDSGANLLAAIAAVQNMSTEKVLATVPSHWQLTYYVLDAASRLPSGDAIPQLVFSYRDFTSAIRLAMAQGLIPERGDRFLRIASDLGDPVEWELVLAELQNDIFGFQDQAPRLVAVRFLIYALLDERYASATINFLSKNFQDGTLLSILSDQPANSPTHIALAAAALLSSIDLSGSAPNTQVGKETRSFWNYLVSAESGTALYALSKEYSSPKLFLDLLLTSYLDTEASVLFVDSLLDDDLKLPLSAQEFSALFDFVFASQDRLYVNRLPDKIADTETLLTQFATIKLYPRSYRLGELLVSSLQSSAGYAHYLPHLGSEILALDADKWGESLRGTAEGLNLLGLALSMRTANGQFQLTAPAVEAIYDDIVSVGHGQSDGDTDRASRLATLLSLVPSRRGALARRVYGWTKDQPAATAVRVVRYLATSLPLAKGLRAPDVIQGLVLPVLADPSLETLAWLLRALEAGAIDLVEAGAASGDLERAVEAAIAGADSEQQAVLRQIDSLASARIDRTTDRAR